MAKNFEADYGGIGEMLCMPAMVADMERRAVLVMVRADSLAPVGDPDNDPHPGRYKASFVVESGVKTGDNGARAYGRVTNTSDEALPIEYGFRGQPQRRVMGRSLGAAGDDGREPYAGSSKTGKQIAEIKKAHRAAIREDRKRERQKRAAQ